MDTRIISPYKNIIAGLAIIIVFCMVVRGMFSHYSLQKEGVAAKTRESEERELIIKRWERLKRDKDEMSKVFLTEDTLLFKKIVEEKAKASNISISSIKTSNMEKDFYWETIMQLSVTCAYNDIISFARGIEEKSIVIEKAEIFRGKGGNGIEVKLKLKGVTLKKW